MSRSKLPPTLVARVIERDAGVCVLAGPNCSGRAVTADHRAGRGTGGDPRGVLNDPANLVAACTVCNGRKEDATGAEREGLRARGLRILRHGQTSQRVLDRARLSPVQWPDGSWWMLGSDGSRELARAAS